MASPATKVPNVLGNRDHGFLSLLGRQVGNVDQILKDWAVLSGDVADVRAKGLR